MTQEQGVKRALVISAHPDDSEFGCGGTVALWSQDGWEFSYLICTDGSKGTDNPEISPQELVQMRHQEQRDAAATVGGKEVFFLDFEDGELTHTRDALREVVRYIRLVQPDAVFTHDPTVLFHREGFINHSDHRCAGLLAVDAVYPAARDRLNFPELLAEGLQPHKVRAVYMWGANDPDFVVDITSVIDAKIRALQAHRSQFGGREEFVEFVLNRWRNDEGRYQERFRLIRLER